MAELPETFNPLDAELNDFIRKPTSQKARKLWLGYTQEGLPVPVEVLSMFTEDVKKQIEAYGTDHPTERDEDELLMLRVHLAISGDDPYLGKVSQKKVFEHFAKFYDIESKGDGSESWEVVKSRYKRWVRRRMK